MSTATSGPPGAERTDVSPCFVCPEGDELIRRDLHGPEHLDELARQLAATSTCAPRRTPAQPLLRRLIDNARFLRHAHRQIRQRHRSDTALPPDAAWLLDNFHIIEETLREVREDLPAGYYHLLPKLAHGPLAGYPRVYALALALVAHTDSSLDEAHILRFVQTYQSVAPLTIGELWAVAIMLRLSLVENLRRLAQQMLGGWRDCRDADTLAHRHWLGREGQRPPQPPADWPLTDPFTVHLSRVLRDAGSAGEPGVAWLEARLRESGTALHDVVRREGQRQAANQVCVGNCVTSLRVLAALDWNVFFEKASHVERVLERDPGGIYPRQDFATRDRYRQVVERLARGCDSPETEVAHRAIALAALAPADRRADAAPLADDPRRHVGYYLVGPGRTVLQRQIGYRPRFRDWLTDLVRAHPAAVFFGCLAGGTLALLGGLGWLAAICGAGPGILLLVLVAGLLPASAVAVAVVNYLVTALLPPRSLPRFDFKDGIPDEHATFVVVPCMLTRPSVASELVERLEIHYLANSDANLFYALLTDFADAPAEHMPQDEDCLRPAVEGIEALQNRYGGGTRRFFLLHRRRLYNPGEGCWMGWERKRGKLVEFNRLLRGAGDTSYTLTSVPPDQLPRVRFVITLDADTQLPRETARRLVGTLAHPLNRPRFDPRLGRVVEGYGVLQPRVNIHMVAAARTLFARLHAGSAGIDPYSVAVSDVYQDLFGTGTYTGKGIYDVDAFEAAAGQRFPDNAILSHDLIEGNFARCGLATEVQLLDEFPPRYNVWASREHRWVRGDWQILPWLLGSGAAALTRDTDPRIAGHARVGIEPGLPLLERWKIFDNLRRSLAPAGVVLFLVLGWTVLPGPAWVWTALGLLSLAAPLVLHLVDTARRMATAVVATAPGREPRAVWQNARAELPLTALQSLLGIAFVVDHARLCLDAVGRTLFRLFVSRRRLLEWLTATEAEQRAGNSLYHYVRAMALAELTAAAIAVLVATVRPEALPVAAPVLLAWLSAPVVAYLVSQPRRAAEPRPLPEAGVRQFRRIARKTWSFFEAFVGPGDNWLPPDNYQESPRGFIAHRTSPTNIGLMLLSTLAAHDLGYIGLRRLLDRLEPTFDTLERLERFHGHFLNWYDTTTLKPLPPAYISSVDSGNLLACLVTLEQGLREKADDPAVGTAAAQGLADTFALLVEGLERLAFDWLPTSVSALQSLRKDVSDARGLLAERPDSPGALAAWLARTDAVAADLAEKVRQLGRAIHDGEPGRASGQPSSDLERWADAFASHARELCDELAGADDGLAPAVLRQRCQRLADRAAQLQAGMDFKVLYNNQRHLFAVGYNLAHGRLDAAYYDLLASESALTSFLAVARGEAPRRHWLQLGRPLTWTQGGLTLLSWGGTMFEYMMPRLLLNLLPGSLLERSACAAVARHIEYSHSRGVPWGISESGMNLLGGGFDYQYQSFGVPGLGLKRGLGRDLVIAPYATGLAAMVAPALALENFRRLSAEGAEGPFGYYEAVDYTPGRLDPPQRSAVVRSYMAHHQGMLLLGLTNRLLGDPMPRRFHTLPIIRATELLLQERMPHTAPLYQPYEEELPAVRPAAEAGIPQPVSRRLTTPRTAHPRTHLLSNGQYTVLVTNAGAGFSTWRNLAVTRWREDATRDAWGQFCYVRDLTGGLLWSAGHQPVCRPADHYEVLFSIDKAEFRRTDGFVETHLEVTVSPEHNAELRRLTLTNHDTQAHELELTSYAEVVLAPHTADLAHPAFGKLFVQTEYVPALHALLSERRPRAADQPPVYAVHALAVEGDVPQPVQYETDRAVFLGRGRDPSAPAALGSGVALSGSTGAVLDPIVCLRYRVRLEPGTSFSLAFTTAVAGSRDEALALADTYNDYHSVTRAFELAWAAARVELDQMRLSTEEVHLFQRLAAHLIYASPTLRAPADVLTANQQGQPGLWKYGISGDNPILLVTVAQAAEIGLARQALEAHAYLRSNGLEFDLVLLDEQSEGYVQEVRDRLVQVAQASDSHHLIDKPGGVFLRKAAGMPELDRRLFLAAARVVLKGSAGPLGEQIERLERQVPPVRPRALVPSVQPPPRGEAAAPRLPAGVLFDNGYGGFLPDGREYLIPCGPGRRPLAPWSNVIANPSFGFLVTESGAGYTWAGNSQQNRLTPWSNDPVSDPPGEVLYLRDERNGQFWAVPADTAAGGSSGWLCRHGQGYSVFEQSCLGLDQELLLFVPAEDPVKLMRLRVRNRTELPRRLSATLYVEWVLGTVRDRAPMQVLCAIDPVSGAVFARNPFARDFADRVAFADVNLRPRSLTTDRTEFLGRNGSPARPAALGRVGLSGRVEPGGDPCAAIHAAFEVGPGGQAEVVFLLGQADSAVQAQQLLGRYKQPGRVERALEEVRRLWDGILDTVQVRTPDRALDLLLNRWLLYQTLGCRLWGRSAFYQSGGAYGFRDQLQDVMALTVAAPQEARAHLLRAAAHQFLEGDVQHWWHPPGGLGVRTRISDDFLWLPFAVCHYVLTTSDDSVLDEPVAFLKAELLGPDQEEYYGGPAVTAETASLYEHCVRAIAHGMRFGSHGLPLMGTGDWNDGMNRVGAGGKGETVWGGWFLLTVLDRFAALAGRRGDTERADHYRAVAKRLLESLEGHGWDGEWYRRAYFDDGTPLGSAGNSECRIDSLPQTWAVISGRADPERARRAMASVDRLLVRREEGLVLLFLPPFEHSTPHPGYIAGYLPGIRENGGQYTHAATWVVKAAAALGMGDLAALLLAMLNPAYHARTVEEVQRYRVEPYVVAGDVYGAGPHVGRGGWTWYSGSAGWLYRVALEDVLGFQVRGHTLCLRPCVATLWQRFDIFYRHHSARYHLHVERDTSPGDGAERVSDRVQACSLDGTPCDPEAIPLTDDGREHEIRVVLG